MIDTRPMKRDLFRVRCWQFLLAGFLLFDVVIASYYIVSPGEHGLAYQVLAVVLNIAGAVYGWNVIQTGEKVSKLIRATIAMAERINRGEEA